jgi:hypothetical protein
LFLSHRQLHRIMRLNSILNLMSREMWIIENRNRTSRTQFSKLITGWIAMELVALINQMA